MEERCVDGATCADDGICRVTVEAGGACDALSPCGWQLTCEDGTCVGLGGAEGDLCDVAAEGACSGGLACVRHPIDDYGVCGPALARGEACDRDRECADPLVCVRSQCDDVPLEGEACSGTCEPGRVCGLGPAVCLLPALGEGDLCARGGCPEGLACQSVSGSLEYRCAPTPELGEPCPELICAAGLVCLDSVCATPVIRAEGESCSDREPCVEGAHCYSGTCLVPIPAGSSCRGESALACGRGAWCDTDESSVHWPGSVI